MTSGIDAGKLIQLKAPVRNAIQPGVFMDQFASETSDGLVIVALQIRDEDRRQQAIHHLEDLLAERPTPAVFEFSTADWDDGLWEEEIEWFSDLLDGTRDRVVVWRFDNGSYSRFTIGNSD